jgi:hypothetical protein
MGEKIATIAIKSGDRLTVLGTLDVVHRDASNGQVRGWFYRFESGGGWLLVPLDQVAYFAFEDKPGGIVGGPSR